jgi:creatinine amidohydrolase
MVRELVISLLGYGASAVLVLDTGISTIAPIDQAIEGLNALHLKVHAGPHYRDAAGRLSTQLHGSHADELETSRLLALAPHLVDMGRAAASPAEPPGAGPMQHVNPSEANYSASGSIGDPAAATADKGWVLLDAMVKDMTDTVRTWRAVSAQVRKIAFQAISSKTSSAPARQTRISLPSFGAVAIGCHSLTLVSKLKFSNSYNGFCGSSERERTSHSAALGAPRPFTL